MTKRDELLALAERCEKASEGSRDLDAEIAAILRVCPTGEDWVQNWTGEWRAINGLVHLIGDYGSSGNFRPPAYTTSLDAAMTLVPEGWWLTLDRYSISDRSPDPFAWRVWMKRIVGDVDGDGPCATQEVFAHAVSAELALCAAALRAQAEMEG